MPAKVNALRVVAVYHVVYRVQFEKAYKVYRSESFP